MSGGHSFNFLMVASSHSSNTGGGQALTRAAKAGMRLLFACANAAVLHFLEAAMTFVSSRRLIGGSCIASSATTSNVGRRPPVWRCRSSTALESG